ncbi:MAG TPA: MogA/MoaB family molybdenum cofactor biosynthesis protein [Methylomirabilota bacterium]|jgi:molybdenum cofactor synthesis domain-containing protein|nr:MogA/MoaB family molybdenum cofactor biosynthesis protein [Methylomirabilota bacterium]
MRVAILTISDSTAKGQREDASGPAVVAFCRGLGWEIAETLCIPDDPAGIRERLSAIADGRRADIIFTTGGTGIGPRDNTPEATVAIADRIIPGVSEEMRRKGMEKTPTAVLSRAVTAVRAHTIIVNLPGSPKGAVESLESIAHLLSHAVHVLHGARHD